MGDRRISLCRTCSLNCISIAVWERDLDRSQRKHSFATRFSKIGFWVRLFCAMVSLAALVAAIVDRDLMALAACLAFSAILLATLDSLSIPLDERSALADLVLLTPAALLAPKCFCELDPIARYYRWLEMFTFGSVLHKARNRWIDRIAPPKRALVLGQGDGRFVCQLLRVHGEARVDCVDASGRMLEIARQRVGKLPAQRCQSCPIFSARRDLLVARQLLRSFGSEFFSRLFCSKRGSFNHPETRTRRNALRAPVSRRLCCSRKICGSRPRKILAVDYVPLLSRNKRHSGERAYRSDIDFGSERICLFSAVTLATWPCEIRALAPRVGRVAMARFRRRCPRPIQPSS